MSESSISKGVTVNGKKKATVNVTVNISYSHPHDAPPELAPAIAESVGKILAFSLSEEAYDQIAQNILEIRVSAQLLSDLNELNTEL